MCAAIQSVVSLISACLQAASLPASGQAPSAYKAPKARTECPVALLSNCQFTLRRVTFEVNVPALSELCVQI